MQATITTPSQFAKISRDRVAEAHRTAGREVIAETDTRGSRWYVVQTDGRPTHLITAGGDGESFEYELPADVNPYLPLDSTKGPRLLSTALRVTRRF